MRQSLHEPSQIDNVVGPAALPHRLLKLRCALLCVHYNELELDD